ncbi:hypothetical protein B0H12DRAFT_1075637 [Mycena haematopus]|nr:hypothetical protein B0H12DRAFT_1075637 [Mycena haematopus]
MPSDYDIEQFELGNHTAQTARTVYGRTKSGRNGLGSDTGIKMEGVKVQDGNMINLCDTTQVDEEGVGNHSDDGRRSWWMPNGRHRKAEPREVKGQTPIDAGGRRAAKGGSPEDEWWKV